MSSEVLETSEALRLLVYDRTCRGYGPLPGLTHAWWTGARLYRSLGRLDEMFGATTWDEALDWLSEHQSGRTIAEIQFWGHGNWGKVKIDGDPLDRAALRRGHPRAAALARVRDRMTPSSLWWFRTCETFGGDVGHDFARAWTDYFRCPAAGHTYIIGYWQSGLHALAPGASPDWDAAEAIVAGTPAQPEKAAWSTPWAPNTITCLQGRLPDLLTAS